MEALSHGLWTAAGILGVKRAKKHAISAPWTIFWGVFPDFLAFTLIVLWYAFQLLQGESVRDLPAPIDIEPLAAGGLWILELTSALYNIGHSAIVFGAVFALVAILRRRVPFPMLGWAFHIVLDLFTHSYAVFPSPMLWPLAVFKFEGISWHQWWFTAANYTALIFVYAVLLTREHVGKAKTAVQRPAVRFGYARAAVKEDAPVERMD